MKIFKIIIWVLLGLFILIQFFPVTYPETVEVNGNDLVKNNTISKDVELILKTSCYDCHSNETRYPWYSYVAPVKWLVIRDIKLGRGDLNFSDWSALKTRDKIKLLDEIAEEVDEGNMPMPIYTVIHRNAALDEERKKILIGWTEQMMNDILGE
jgi:hypothetical protein